MYLSGDINAAWRTLSGNQNIDALEQIIRMTITSRPLTPEHVHAGSLHRADAPGDGFLFTPLVDFLFLGGGSLLLMVPLLFADVPKYDPLMTTTVLFLAHFINSPHFANSYQIFYRGFAEKAFGQAYPTHLRIRYIIAGIVAPLALICFFAIAFVSGSPRAVGFGFNIMLFLVGWHYVKQGYGMIIVDSVLKKNFFTPRDKSILVVNAYLCWLLSWGFLNHTVAKRDMFGLSAYSFPIPDFLLIIAGVATAISTALTLVVMYSRWRSGKPFPFNGVVAYLVTLYIWMVFPAVVAPAVFVGLLVLVTPAAHSLQYLIVVWRYQLNVERDKRDSEQPRSLFKRPATRLAYFFIFGVVISFFGFWIMPATLDLFVGYDRGVFGNQMFPFMFAIFINVHHYFLDNVMWRRENPDVGKYLFRPNHTV